MLQKILSIDIGTKNFSYCIEERDDSLDGDNVVNNGRITVIANTNVKTQKNVVELLDKLYKEISECNGGILVENQMRINTTCVKMQQHVMTYFMIVHPSLNVTAFSSKHKTHVFTNEKMTKYQRKKFSVMKAVEILTARGESLDILNDAKKKDDMADVVLQIQAYKILQKEKNKK